MIEGFCLLSGIFAEQGLQLASDSSPNAMHNPDCAILYIWSNKKETGCGPEPHPVSIKQLIN